MNEVLCSRIVDYSIFLLQPTLKISVHKDFYRTSVVQTCRLQNLYLVDLSLVIKIIATCLWKLIVQVSVVLRKTVGGSDWRFDSLGGGHLGGGLKSGVQFLFYVLKC